MEPLQGLLGRLRRPWTQFAARFAWARQFLWGALFSVLLTLLLAGQVLPQQVLVVPGEPSPKEILASRDVVDRLTTEARAREAEGKVPTQFRVDDDVDRRAKLQVWTFFGELEALRTRKDLAAAQKVAELSTRQPRVPELVLTAALGASPDDLSRAESVTVNRLDLLLSQPVSDRDVSELQARQDRTWTPEGIEDRNLQVLVKELVKAGIAPNLERDDKATEAERNRARNEVLLRPTTIKRGEKIVGKGERVTPEKFEVLKELGVVGPPGDRMITAGVALFAVLIVGMLGVYLRRFRPELLRSDSRLLLIGLTTTLTLAVSLVMRNWSGFAMPLAAGTMLLSILLDLHVGLAAAIGLGLLTGAATGGDWPVTFVATISAIAGVYNLRRVEQRTDIIRAGLVVAGVTAMAILALYMIQGKEFGLAPGQMAELGRNLGAAIVNGLLSAVLTIGSLPFLESLFGILTPIKLLELANPNHPLLRRLMVDAPGSYHHTILVANLCEAAAETVGGDPVLSRVGAFFHDIGKAKRPYFFVENQFGGENPHDRLPPHLSAMIIAQHVKDGVELSREFHLPPEIMHFVREHHGDMLISFFYDKATENGEAERVLEEDFRYDGPRPQSRETAICMLADGCEASVRAMRRHGPLSSEQIEAQVQRIIQDRLRQGQLNNSDLTLADLDKIGKAFVKVLAGLYHDRMDYPAFAAKEALHEDLDQQPAARRPANA